MRERLNLTVNGENHDLVVPVNKTLLEVLREDLAMTGTKHGCELGECGTCTVLLDGEPVLSCLMLAVDLNGAHVQTVESLAHRSLPHELQVAFAELGASQCGYCSPGMLVSAKALLDQQPQPSRDEIREYLSGNLCRCTGYLKIVEAVELAAGRIAERRTSGDADPEHRRRPARTPEQGPDMVPVEGKRGSVSGDASRS